MSRGLNHRTFPTTTAQPLLHDSRPLPTIEGSFASCHRIQLHMFHKCHSTIVSELLQADWPPQVYIRSGLGITLAGLGISAMPW